MIVAIFSCGVRPNHLASARHDTEFADGVKDDHASAFRWRYCRTCSQTLLLSSHGIILGLGIVPSERWPHPLKCPRLVDVHDEGIVLRSDFADLPAGKFNYLSILF